MYISFYNRYETSVQTGNIKCGYILSWQWGGHISILWMSFPLEEAGRFIGNLAFVSWAGNYCVMLLCPGSPLSQSALKSLWQCYRLKFQINASSYLGPSNIYVNLYLVSQSYVYSLYAKLPIKISNRFWCFTLCMSGYIYLLCSAQWKDEKNQKVKRYLLINPRCIVFQVKSVQPEMWGQKSKMSEKYPVLCISSLVGQNIKHLIANRGLSTEGDTGSSIWSKTKPC